MRRELLALALGTVLLMACGGRPSAPVGFINHTRHSDAELWSLWKMAQGNLSRQVDINPLQRTLGNAAPQILAGDARVWKISPRQLTVSAQQDVSPAMLHAATGVNRADPTGLIACPGPCNVRYAAAYSLYLQNVTRYAVSWESSRNNFDGLVQYEFENQILNALGYDMRWR